MKELAQTTKVLLHNKILDTKKRNADYKINHMLSQLTEITEKGKGLLSKLITHM